MIEKIELTATEVNEFLRPLENLSYKNREAIALIVQFFQIKFQPVVETVASGD